MNACVGDVERGRHVVVRVRLDSELPVAADVPFGPSPRRVKLFPGPLTVLLLPRCFGREACRNNVLDSYGTIASR
jgi:hypothetical protein